MSSKSDESIPSVSANPHVTFVTRPINPEKN